MQQWGEGGEHKQINNTELTADGFRSTAQTIHGETQTFASQLKSLRVKRSVLTQKVSVLYNIKVAMFIYSSYSSQCRKLKISMSNGFKIPHLVMYFMCL